ncbi:Elongator complex protein 5 [Xylariales sp. PMI_506]|nr:Elongator complex protein 5 [Xylariales sp. PMI_506]
MPPSAQSHSRSHALLLFQKLLNLRDSASPLTLVLDNLEQSGRPVLREFIARAKITKSKVIYLSFATLRKPADVDIFIRARHHPSAASLQAEVTSHYPSGTPGHAHKVLLVIDTLNPLSNQLPSQLPALLSSLITSPAISLVALHHLDVPFVPSPSSGFGEYEPHPLTVLCHLATAILRVSSVHQAAKRREARNRSLQEPEWGLGEGREGVLIGLRQNRSPAAAVGTSGVISGSGPGFGSVAGSTTAGVASGAAATEGVVVEMELRRRSGRSVGEKFVLLTGGPPALTSKLVLLTDHPLFRDPADDEDGAGGAGAGEEDAETTFSLGLTEKQRKDREGIVLPYFDAQTDIGAGEGGRILYEMGREDDFDDEEDEI